MCAHAAWKSILEEDCPKTCGLCDSGFKISGDCVDEVPDCKINGRMICQSKSLGAFAKRYCKKTCGYCKDSTRMAAVGLVVVTAFLQNSRLIVGVESGHDAALLINTRFCWLSF
ncbi:hypothetical protein GCK32_011208 [Trichostrongylus colubriformis]|uniref:ShKT domain-containing protein n=1 Tax=Trichostrongylus colubriformis TaxID=6319 RepID=A0AAN8G8X6_TRICO